MTTTTQTPNDPLQPASKPPSPAYLRKRKALLVLPLVVVPFIFGLFYSLSGGAGRKGNALATWSGQGFNIHLPMPLFRRKDTLANKLGSYQRADADSARLREQVRQDPYHAKGGPECSGSLSASMLHPVTPDPADGLMKKLGQLKGALQEQTPARMGPPLTLSETQPVMYHTRGPDISRFQTLLHSIQAADTARPDQHLEQINGMLDKVLWIQHPQQELPGVKEKEVPVQPSAELVKLPEEPTAVSDMGGGYPPKESREIQDTGYTREDPDGFVTIDDEDQAAREPAISNTIAAVVEQDQTVIAGGTVVLRLLEEATIHGARIPRDQLVYGQAAIKGDRLMIHIHSIRDGRSIYPVDLDTYDMDGQAGIPIRNGLAREVARQSADQTVNSVGVGSVDPMLGLGAQAAEAGIQTARNLLSRKIKLVQVPIEAGHPVVLKNNKESKTH